MPILNIAVEVRGSINGGDLEGSVKIKLDTSNGLIAGELIVSRCPPDFAVIAASGQSWVCNSNSGGAVTITAVSRNLLELADFNYDLERRNEFPDGSAIDMHFEVRRIDEHNVEVKGNWDGTYGLPIDIVGMRAPIFEHMEPDGNGKIKSRYVYTLYDSGGKSYDVVTPSQYKFKPISLSAQSLISDQTRIMFFAVEEKEKNRAYTLFSQSTMFPAPSLGPNTLVSAANFGSKVLF